jgi:hypothetical protein
MSNCQCCGQDVDVIYCGYEIPKNSHRLTKKVLKRLERDGVVYVTHDDGEGRIAREELEKIAGAIGLRFLADNGYEFVIFDEDGVGNKFCMTM